MAGFYACYSFYYNSLLTGKKKPIRNALGALINDSSSLTSISIAFYNFISIPTFALGLININIDINLLKTIKLALKIFV